MCVIIIIALEDKNRQESGEGVIDSCGIGKLVNWLNS
jgi:hypothetical protein